MDYKMEVRMKKMMVNLLAQKMEKKKVHSMVKLMELMKVTKWEIMTGKPFV